MGNSSIKFGTSGLRGLAHDLLAGEAHRYACAFLAHLAVGGRLGSGRVLIGRDLRASSGQIALDCISAAAAAGLTPVDCGVVPTPALALQAMSEASPAIMVTGSHIPADRNGLKFYGPEGEISKTDEAGIVAALRAPGMRQPARAQSENAALERYIERYRALLPEAALAGWRIGVFEHSTVLRDILAQLLIGFGAEVVRLGRSETFVALDTEAPDDPVFAPLAGWVWQQGLDAVISADGDGDRPLIVDGNGDFVRGDALAAIAARFLGAVAVATPVTSNSSVTSLFGRVERTRVGSPYVIAAMRELAEAGARPVIGFEANGGLMLGSTIAVEGMTLPALPTRDAVLPLLAVLGYAARERASIAELVVSLGFRPALSGRLQDICAERAAAFLTRLSDAHFAGEVFAGQGNIASRSQIDGEGFTLSNGAVVHFRASGNAPELRCYVEAASAGEAEALLAWGLGKARQYLAG